MTNKEVIEALQAEFGDAIFEVSEPYGMLNVYTTADNAKKVVVWLKNHTAFQLNFLTNIAAIHYPHNKGEELEVIYQLNSLVNKFRMRVKAKLPIDKPEIETLVDVYAGANWMERETYDFFGVIFKGHPNLKKILNMEDQDYFPLRKEYPLEDPTREDKDNRFFGRS